MLNNDCTRRGSLLKVHSIWPLVFIVSYEFYTLVALEESFSGNARIAVGSNFYTLKDLVHLSVYHYVPS